MIETRLLVRQLIGDIQEGINDYESYETATLAGRTFILSEENPISTTIDVYINEVETAEINYNFDSETNALVIVDSLMTLTDEVRISYDAYRKYSANEINAYINSAFVWMSVLKVKDWEVANDIITPTLTVQERRLIALVASILVNGNLKTYKTKEFTVQFNEDATAEQKIKKLATSYNPSLGIFSWITYDGDESV